MPVSQFRKGSAVFNCRCCGRRTRDTTGTNVGLCTECDQISMIDNYVGDNNLTPEQVAEEDAKIVKLKAAAIAKGGSFPVEVEALTPEEAIAKVRQREEVLGGPGGAADSDNS